MNYFAHGRGFLHDPYLLAGTAVPDWLNVVDRQARVRSKNAAQFTDHSNSPIARLARGIVRHHQDDAWFHQTPAFVELSYQFTMQIRDALPGDDGLRPSFLGHILVELLLDAALIQEFPDELHAYYDCLEQVDSELISRAINLMQTRRRVDMSIFLPRFLAIRFLYDYLEDAKLLFRLNQIMNRVKLASLPDTFLDYLPEAREVVYRRADELLQPVTDPSH